MGRRAIYGAIAVFNLRIAFVGDPFGWVNFIIGIMIVMFMIHKWEDLD